MTTPHIPQMDTADTEEGNGNDLPDILTVEEVSDWLRVNKKTVYDAASRGEIPCRKIGRVYRFSKTVVLQWLTGQGRVKAKKRGSPWRST